MTRRCLLCLVLLGCQPGPQAQGDSEPAVQGASELSAQGQPAPGSRGEHRAESAPETGAEAAGTGAEAAGTCSGACAEMQAAQGGYTPTRSAVDADGAERFGPPPGDAPEVALATLLADAASYAGQRVRTRGEVRRVCRMAGCWVELAETDGGRLRVPMAGHALSIPQRAIGRDALVEGLVSVRPLSDAQKAHYRAEGMTATDVAASLAATTVVVAP